jgi:Asp-tRNA(Asn)/Glu-tRNA(Gln) amidotransferase A subunit family amidase
MDDLLEVLDVIAEPDEEVKGDFWREQSHVSLPKPLKVDYECLAIPDALRGKRIGVPKMYVGLQDSDPHAKPTTVNPDVVKLWEVTRTTLEGLGAEILYTDFPLVTNYENDSVSGEANNVVGCIPGWQQVERSTLIAKTWNDFLLQNKDPKIKDLKDVDPLMLFPKPKDYLPDTFLEVRNWVNYAGLPELAEKYKDVSVYDVPGLSEALKSLEAQRKRDFEDWMDSLELDLIVFPSQGDVGFADLEFNHDSATHSHKNGVKYSNGNRAIRHMGVPTVSVPMGVVEGRQMPVNLTFAGKAYNDGKLLSYAFAYEHRNKGRTIPPLTPALASDNVRSQPSSSKSKLELTVSAEAKEVGESILVTVHGTLTRDEKADVEIFLDGEKSWNSTLETGSFDAMLYHHPKAPERLGWDLKPLPRRDIMVMVVVKAEGAPTVAKLLFVSPS